MGFCYADDGFNVAHCDWNAACPLWKLTAEQCEKEDTRTISSNFILHVSSTTQLSFNS